MENNQTVRFEKVVTFGKDVFKAIIYSVVNKNSLAIDDITVNLFNTNYFDSEYTYITSKSQHDENRYVNSVVEAVEEYIFRSYQDSAVSKFDNWNGKIK